MTEKELMEEQQSILDIANCGIVYDTNSNLPLSFEFGQPSIYCFRRKQWKFHKYPLLIVSYLTHTSTFVIYCGAIIIKVVSLMKKVIIIHVLIVIKIALFLWTSLLTSVYFLYDTIFTLTGF